MLGANDKNLAWLDLEMTGLDPDTVTADLNAAADYVKKLPAANRVLYGVSPACARFYVVPVQPDCHAPTFQLACQAPRRPLAIRAIPP